MNAISPGQYAGRLLAATRKDVLAALRRATSGAGVEQPGSARSRVIAWLDEHDTGDDFFRYVANENRDDASRLLNAADQHAAAMEHLLKSGVAYGSLATLERALLEAILTLCYVHDREASPERLMLRMIARTLDTFEGSHRAQLHFTRTFTTARRRSGEENIAGVRDLLRAHGVSIEPERSGGTPHIGFMGVRENVKFDATAAARHFLGTDAHHWSTSSGATHSKAWYLVAVSPESDEHGGSAGTSVMGAATLGALRGARALLGAIERFTGFSTRPEQDRVFRREKALVSQLNGGTPIDPVSLDEHEARPPTWRPRTPRLDPFRSQSGRVNSPEASCLYRTSWLATPLGASLARRLLLTRPLLPANRLSLTRTTTYAL